MERPGCCGFAATPWSTEPMTLDVHLGSINLHCRSPAMLAINGRLASIAPAVKAVTQPTARFGDYCWRLP